MVRTATTYTTLLSIAGLFAALIAVIIYRRRNAGPAAAPLLMFMLGLTWWDLAYALHWSSVARPFPTFWLDMTFLGVVVAPTTFFVFARRYTDPQWRLDRRWLLLLSALPLLTLLLLWTDPWHGLFFGRPRDMSAGTILKGGIGFWGTVIYLYAFNMVAVVLLLRAFVKAPPLYRGQSNLVLLGALLPWISNMLSIVGLNPLPEIDLTPLAFTLTGAAFAYSLLFYRLLDIVPVARDLLVEHLSDGVLVLDARLRVVDVNLAARQMLRLGDVAALGRPVKEVLAQFPELAACSAEGETGGRTLVTHAASSRTFDLRVVALPPRGKEDMGRLVVLRDVTDQARAEAHLRGANEQLRVQLAEIERLQGELREQVIRDALTGLFNRRYFDESLGRELARAGREGQPVTLILLDIDHFKRINDRWGHAAGDAMLRAIARLLERETRGGDIVCRFGGEEFVVMMPGAPAVEAAACVERWRALVGALVVPFGGHTLNATISAGVAAYPIHGATREALLHAADGALYISKRLGRDRVTVTTTVPVVEEVDLPASPSKVRS